MVLLCTVVFFGLSLIRTRVHVYRTRARKYLRDCEKLCGRFIHHEPTTDADTARGVGNHYASTLKLYEATFGQRHPTWFVRAKQNFGSCNNDECTDGCEGRINKNNNHTAEWERGVQSVERGVGVERGVCVCVCARLQCDVCVLCVRARGRVCRLACVVVACVRVACKCVRAWGCRGTYSSRWIDWRIREEGERWGAQRLPAVGGDNSGWMVVHGARWRAWFTAVMSSRFLFHAAIIYAGNDRCRKPCVDQ